MTNFLKDNKTVLALILLLGLALRLRNLNFPEGMWRDEFFTYTISMFKFPFDFFEGIKTNCYAPLHYFYVKAWMAIFRNSDFMLRLSSLIPNLLGCFVMYKAGKNYFTKNSSVQIGLACAAIAAISSFLIYFAQEVRIYSMIFLLSSLILLYSIKMYENPSRKNAAYLALFSVLLILEHTIGFIYVIFNTFGLIAYKQKNKKNKDNDPYIPIIAGLILCLPLIPFLFRLFAHPTYFSQWWSPFNWANICFYFTDLFSPVLKNLTSAPVNFYNQIIQNNKINLGFVIFALAPAIIALFLIIKSNIESKRINKYFLSVSLAVFLTVLIAAIAGKLSFFTKYLAELYPSFILMAAIGWAQLNNKNHRIALATIYIFLNLFFIIAMHATNINLLGI